MGLLKLLIILTLVSLPFGEIARLEISKDLGVNLMELLIPITALYGSTYLLIKNKFRIHYGREAFLFISFALLSLLINLSHYLPYQNLIAFLYLLRFFSLFMIFVLVSIQDKRFKKTVQTIMIAGGAIIIALGLIQYFLYPSLRNMLYLGWDEHLYRLFSTFLDPNFTAIFIGLYMIFLIKKIKESSDIRIRNLLIILLIGSSISIILTFSRAAILAFLIVSFFSILRTSYKKYMPILIILSILIIGGMFVFRRSEGTNLLRVASTQARFGSALQAMTVFKDSPIIGIGFNAYRYALDKHNYPSDPRYQDFPHHGQSSTDNSFLFVLATTGILGFILYVNLWTKIIKNNIKAGIENKIIIVSIAFVFICSMFTNALFYTPILLWLFLLLGVKENT